MKPHFLFIILLAAGLGCQRPKHSAVDEPIQDTTGVASPQVHTPIDLKVNLASGIYGSGLKIGVKGDSIYGYYEDAYGWNEQVKAPQYSCAYSFKARYHGSSSMPLKLDSYPEATGTLDILSREEVQLTLSMNPCQNEQTTTERLKLEKGYPLMEVKVVRAARSYFYSRPDESAKGKAYLIEGDRVDVTDIKDEWYQVVFSGERSTTTGWMPSLAFESGSSATRLAGTWVSEAGEPFELFFKFYPDQRYKTWSINSFEPQGMTGAFSTEGAVMLTLYPCGEPSREMQMKAASADKITFLIPGTNSWTRFEKRANTTNLEQAVFLIEKRRIKTTVNSRIISIPSDGAKEKFLDAVCPFSVKPDVISRGEGDFDILRVSSPDKGPLFYAIIQDNEITSLIIDEPVVQWSGLSVGSTFGELKKALPSATVTRSQTEGRIFGSADEFSFSFGYLTDDLFDAEAKSIPDSVTIKQIIL